MTDIVLIIAVFIFALPVSILLARVARSWIARAQQDRLKAHLDWIDPVAASARRRSTARR